MCAHAIFLFITSRYPLVARLRNDEIQLKDALVKLQSLNEALGQDKIDLNKVIRQLEMEKDELVNDKQELEMEKSAIKEVFSLTCPVHRPDFLTSPAFSIARLVTLRVHYIF